ncbi:MAG: type II toxin-antitoxin system VapC family toxin [Sphingorhabdus sp.]
MRLLLDTHIVLWRLTADSRLPKRAIEIMDEEALSVDVSAVSIWEVAIKWAMRKGRADDMPVSGKAFLRELERALVEPMPIQPIHASAIDDLPPVHGDPFDRLLIATAAQEGMIFLTHDAMLRNYGDFVLVV